MKSFPYINLKQSLILLRVSTAFIFLAHSIVRILNNTMGQFGTFLNNKGFVYGYTIVLGITAFEIIGGILLALGFFAKWISLGFIILLLVGIIVIHVSQGWFVGEHGSGGCEYSFILIIALIVIAANKK